MNEYIAENNRIAFVQYTHEDDGDMFACWQDRDTQKGYNYAFDGSLDNLCSIDISAFPFWLEELYNIPACRSCRIGSALFRYVEEWAKEQMVQCLMLSTATKDHKRILHFYIEELGMEF